MRRLLTALLAVPALLLVAATCVSNVQQQGDRGPWIGEVVNPSDQTVFAVSAQARVIDARDREFYPGRIGVLACPSKLLPSERGAFQLFVPTDDLNPDFILRDPALPLRASFDAIGNSSVGTGQARGDGLLVEELSRDRANDTVRVRLTNNGPGAQSSYTVCAVVRTADGVVTEVGRVDGPSLPAQLVPGESVELTIAFRDLPDGSFYIAYHALGLLNAPYEDCCPLGASDWRPVDLRYFSVLLPPGWSYEPAQGIDSFVGSFVGPNARLEFDYGAFSNSLPYEQDPTYDVHEETISGRTAKIVISNNNGVVGVHFEQRALGPRAATSALTVAGSAFTAEQEAIALQIFRSIRICECIIR